MERLEITVPDYNDSLTRVILSGQAYLLRFTYNDTYAYWSLGFYDWQEQALAVGIKVVPRFPLNLFIPEANLGLLAVFTDLERITRNSFKEGQAVLAYVS